MAKKSRLEITFETRRRTVVRTRRRQRAAWCEGCAEVVNMLTPDEAAQLLATSARDIYRRVEAGALHFSETEGRVLVCAASLGLDITDRNRRETKNVRH